MAKPDITVAIPTYNREKELIDTIGDVLSQSYRNLELIVIDQSRLHTPEVTDALKKIKDKRFRYFATDPPSLPAARNYAFSVAKAPIVLFIDDDVKVDKDLVKNHLARYAMDPDLSAVGGRVLQAGFPIKKEVLKFDKYGISHGVFTATEPSPTNAFPGGNCSLKVVDALAVGGFDSRYRGNAFREESDMSLKMTRAGMKIYFEPKAELLHLAATYGGLRVQTHIYDSFTFYKNEIFFTIRAVKFRNLPLALIKKAKAYCESVPLLVAIKRLGLFALGFIGALLRLLFGRQIVSRVRPR